MDARLVKECQDEVRECEPSRGGEELNDETFWKFIQVYLGQAHFLCFSNSQCLSGDAALYSLPYIELTVSFLIGPKRTVTFRNQHLRQHLAADYPTIMSRIFRVTVGEEAK